MAEPIHSKIKRSLQAAEGLYHRLVLLVGETGSGKTAVLRDVADEFGTSVININLALSSELLELTTKQRSLRLPGSPIRGAAESGSRKRSEVQPPAMPRTRSCTRAAS